MRVWPMMAFQIILVLGLMMLLHPLDVAKYQPLLPGLLTFTSSYGEWVGLSPAVLWTLRAEFWFYVLFAAAFYFTGLRHLSGLILVAIILSWIAKFWLGHIGSLPFGFQPAVHTLVTRPTDVRRALRLHHRDVAVMAALFATPCVAVGAAILHAGCRDRAGGHGGDRYLFGLGRRCRTLRRADHSRHVQTAPCTAA
jgi:peptidoglycan/LPS O-acetylase OafA/YrhL